MKATETTRYLCKDDAGLDVLSAAQSSSQGPGANSEKPSIHAGRNNLTTTREVSASLQHALSTRTNLEKLPASCEGNAPYEGTKFDPSYVPSQESPLLAHNMSE